MKRMLLTLLAGSLTALCAVVIGCGPVDHDTEPLPKLKGNIGGSAISIPVVQLKPVDSKQFKYEGTISGSVKWDGGKPDFDTLTNQLKTAINGSQDRDYCLSGKDFEIFQQSYRIGTNGNLGNVFVWVTPEPGFFFDVPDTQLPTNKEVLVSQPHCAFLPHCSGVFASRYKNGKQDTTGCQTLVVQNDARIAHNAALSGALNGTRNALLPAWDGKGPTNKARYDTPPLRPERNELTLACGVHGWMRAYVRVYDHPYHAISSIGADLKDLKNPKWEDQSAADFGTFKFTGVPTGVKLRLFAWHEAVGHLLGASGEVITIDPATKELKREITAKGK